MNRSGIRFKGKEVCLVKREKLSEGLFSREGKKLKNGCKRERINKKIIKTKKKKKNNEMLTKKKCINRIGIKILGLLIMAGRTLDGIEKSKEGGGARKGISE